jgi:dolichol kinase
MAKLRKEEIQRKILHFIFGTIMPFGIFFFHHQAAALGWKFAPWTLPPVILAPFLIGFILMEIIRLRIPAAHNLFKRYFNSMLRAEESKTPTGATYISAAGLICSLVFRNHPAVSCMVLSTFIWGDAVAALVGQSIGRIKIGKKSLEGSLGCFAMSMILYLVVFPFIPGLLDVFGGRMPFAFAFIGSVCVTVFELIPLRITPKLIINDNLFVPVLTGYILILLYTA